MKAYFLWLSKLITILVLIFVAIPFFIGILMGVGQKLSKTNIATGNKKVAVIELMGVIKDSKEVLKKLYDYSDDESVAGIVLRIDSPGGAVGPSQDIYQAVKFLKSKKPIVASMGTVAASGGLYSALGASKIFCQSGTLTGSIGVIMQIPNFEKIADKLGVDFITVKSGKFKDVGNTFRSMTPPEKKFIQSTVDEVYGDFFKAVVESRNLDPKLVKEFADGRVILGSQALKYGLVDEMGSLYDAARSVYKLAGLKLSENEIPELFYPDVKLERLKKILEGVLDFPLKLGLNESYRLMFLMSH